MKKLLKMINVYKGTKNESLYPTVTAGGKVKKEDCDIIKGFLEETEKDIVRGDFRTDNIPHKEFNIQIF